MWKPVPNYEGLYEVSESGEIRSVDTMIKCANWRIHKGHTLKGTVNNKGYRTVQLIDRNGKRKKHLVHRVVATVFCEKPSGCDIVNHLDFNPLNNCADNLEWTTFKGNSEYSAKAGHFCKSGEWLRKIIENQNRKKVIAVSIDGSDTIEFDSVNDTKASGFQPSCVSNCCKGKRATHAGYKWRYAE